MTNPMMMSVSGITVKMSPLTNSSSFSAIAPIAAEPMDFCAKPVPMAVPATAIAAASPSSPVPTSTIAQHLLPMLPSRFHPRAERDVRPTAALVEFHEELRVVQPQAVQERPEQPEREIDRMPD